MRIIAESFNGEAALRCDASDYTGPTDKPNSTNFKQNNEDCICKHLSTMLCAIWISCDRAGHERMARYRGSNTTVVVI